MGADAAEAVESAADNAEVLGAVRVGGVAAVPAEMSSRCVVGIGCFAIIASAELVMKYSRSGCRSSDKTG